MSSKSNDQGRAYEFICLLTLEEEIKKLRPVNIIKIVVTPQQNVRGALYLTKCRRLTRKALMLLLLRFSN